MKHLQKILVLALSAILVITACIPGTLASRTVETPEATAPETTAAMSFDAFMTLLPFTRPIDGVADGLLLGEANPLVR